jgi:hypothetical protein
MNGAATADTSLMLASGKSSIRGLKYSASCAGEAGNETKQRLS